MLRCDSFHSVSCIRSFPSCGIVLTNPNENDTSNTMLAGDLAFQFIGVDSGAPDSNYATVIGDTISSYIFKNIARPFWVR